MRIAIIGNAGSGKSTLARKLSAELDLPLHEVDRFMWTQGWDSVPDYVYDSAHQAILAEPHWVLDGMGRMASLRDRLDRATHIILCDFPIWQTFWLLAERQEAWKEGRLNEVPGGQSTRPETRRLFEFVWSIDQIIMPDIRDAVTKQAEKKPVTRIESFEALLEFEFSPG